MGTTALSLKHRSKGGWFNIEENSQAEGIYLVVVFKLGYYPAMQFVEYTGEPLHTTIEINPW